MPEPFVIPALTEEVGGRSLELIGHHSGLNCKPQVPLREPVSKSKAEVLEMALSSVFQFPALKSGGLTTIYNSRQGI